MSSYPTVSISVELTFSILFDLIKENDKNLPAIVGALASFLIRTASNFWRQWDNISLVLWLRSYTKGAYGWWWPAMSGLLS